MTTAELIALIKERDPEGSMHIGVMVDGKVRPVHDVKVFSFTTGPEAFIWTLTP